MADPVGADEGARERNVEAQAEAQAQAEALEVLQVPTQRIIEIGLALWAVALLATLLVPALHDGDRSWWPWACVAGLVLGLVGLLYVRRGRGNAHDAG